jgi:ribonuclease R
VTLDAMYVEGLVHITELGGEYYRFDELRQELRGERTGIRYAVGTRVRVQVSRVDLDGRKIDFRMVREAELDRPAGRSDKPRGTARPTSKNWRRVREADRANKTALQGRKRARAVLRRRADHANRRPSGLHPSPARAAEKKEPRHGSRWDLAR